LPAAALRVFSVETTSERVSIRSREERADLSLPEAVATVFGGPDAPAIDGELGEVLRRVFPVPLPLPGFNYV
jgi:hypothetical protein